jgi:hypothetical protein
MQQESGMRPQPIPVSAFKPFDRGGHRYYGRAFQAARPSSVASGNELASSGHADRPREGLVVRIIEIAKRGECDQTCLQNDAVEYVLNEDHRKPA